MASSSSSSSMDKYVFLLTLLLLIAATSSSKAIESQINPLFSKVKVEIFNALEGGSNLTLHCKSKDDDLGKHTLSSGESFQFQFRPNFIVTTLFFCSFQWPEDPSLHYFDVYKQIEDVCGYCPWKAHRQTICGYRGQVGHEDCYPYNKNLEENQVLQVPEILG